MHILHAGCRVQARGEYRLHQRRAFRRRHAVTPPSMGVHRRLSSRPTGHPARSDLWEYADTQGTAQPTAGFLARGSPHRTAFPIARWRIWLDARRLQLRGQLRTGPGTPPAYTRDKRPVGLHRIPFSLSRRRGTVGRRDRTGAMEAAGVLPTTPPCPAATPAAQGGAGVAQGLAVRAQRAPLKRRLRCPGEPIDG